MLSLPKLKVTVRVFLRKRTHMICMLSVCVAVHNMNIREKLNYLSVIQQKWINGFVSMFFFERYHLLAAEWVDWASFWSLSKSLEEDLAFCCILKTTWMGRASMRLILEMDLEVRLPMTYFCFHPRWLVTESPYDNGSRKPQKANVIKMSTVHWLYYVTLQAVNKSYWKQLRPRGSGTPRYCTF